MNRQVNPRARIPLALKLIRERLGDPVLTPSMLAGHVGLDLPVFCRAFKQVTGMTSTDYIAVERVRVAKQLLTKDDLLVKEIAYRVGFGNPNYFTRRFKEVEGRSPSAYRKLNLP
jgi:two-component system response regulator YesN